MDEELDLAIDELRHRSPLSYPLIPVRLSGTIPDIDIGAGRNLRTLQWVDLDDTHWDSGIEALCKAILEPPVAQPPKRIVGLDHAEMVLIPAGEFRMGSNSGDHDEQPIHTVSLSAFYLDVFPVTNARYRQFVAATGRPNPKGFGDDDQEFEPWEHSRFNHDDQPVVCVSWFAALAYAAWAGKVLPSEAQWEYAARGGLPDARYPHGEEIGEHHANYGKHVGRPTPQGTYLENGYGLYDMAGNVWEWCSDVYHASYYEQSPRRDPVAGSMPFLEDVEEVRKHAYDGDFLARSALGHRVIRGASWYDHISLLRVACRNSAYPEDRGSILGFRCARVIAIAEDVVPANFSMHPTASGRG